jgi:ketosteroid isomerase-like protein
MTTQKESLQAAFDSRDLDRLVALLDDRVVWRGLPETEYVDEHDLEGGPQELALEDDDDDHPPMCTSREEVREVFQRFMAGGGTGHPVVLAESGDSVVVDPRPEPLLPFPLHQVFTFRGARIVLIQDYPDRDSALADLTGMTSSGDSVED